jgi:NADPH-dependent 2,4-dienoyl-CoA reductase/sulfur reductase-like enzyme
MIEKGADVSVATCAMPYFVGREVTDRAKLVMNTPDHLAQTLATDVRMSHEVVAIDRAAKKVDVVNLKAPAGSPGARFSLPYDKLIIATGASPALPPIPGLRDLYNNGRLVTLRTLDDMDRIVKRVSEAGPGGHVVVVGAGLIGMEMVEALAHCGLAVTVVEAQSSILPLLDPEMSAPIAQELYNNGVRIVAGQKVVAFHDSAASGGKEAVEVQLETGERLKASFIIQSIGIRPDSQIAEAAGIKVGPNKAIVVNPYMQTSDPDIYAVGDVVSTPFVQSPKPTWLPLGGPANRQARIAADHILLGEKMTQPYRGSFGTAIVRVFDAVAGKTGMTETGIF